MNRSLVMRTSEMLWLDQYLNTFYEIPISWTTQKITKVTKVKNQINFKWSFSNSVSNYDSESIEEHMVNFKGRSSMRQYVTSKPIKLGLKFWYCSASEAGYLYHFDLYFGKKRSEEEILRPGVVLKVTNILKNGHCIFFW